MDVELLLKAAIMGVVEGLTEFLPISSTGHLILAGALLGFQDEKAKVFEIAIQTGAIFAVILVYAQKILAVLRGLPHDAPARRFVTHVLIAFFPAVILGLRTLATALCRAPPLCALCLVPHRLWGGGLAHRPFRLGQLARLTLPIASLGLALQLTLRRFATPNARAARKRSSAQVEPSRFNGRRRHQGMLHWKEVRAIEHDHPTLGDVARKAHPRLL